MVTVRCLRCGRSVPVVSTRDLALRQLAVLCSKDGHQAAPNRERS
jgi:hypothetical protein